MNKNNTLVLSDFDAVIWDMDGVIINTEIFWPQAERSILTKVGVPPHEDFGNATTGLRSVDVMRYWHDRYPWNVDIHSFEQLTNEITDTMIRLVGENGEILPHVYETLTYFNTIGFKQSIASSSCLRLIEKVMNKLNIGSFFLHYSSGVNERFGKPAPDVYLTAAKKLQVQPSRCIVVEDSLNGVMSGYRAGMRVIVIPTDLLLNDQTKLRQIKQYSCVLDSLSKIQTLFQ